MRFLAICPPFGERMPKKTQNSKTFLKDHWAEFERDIIRERTQAGLTAARARGRKGGRPKALTDKKVAMVKELYENKKLTINEICETLKISRTTLYRYITPGKGDRAKL
jgi:DNA invertase Pin-like site-specific DNA recombinase